MLTLTTALAADPISDCRTLRHGDTELAQRACTDAIEQTDRTEHASLVVELLLHLGDVQIARGQYDAAAKALNEAAAIPLTTADWEFEFKIKRKQGQLAFRRDDLAGALSWMRMAERLAHRENDSKAKATAAVDLGVLLRRMGDIESALDQYKSALPIYRPLGGAELAALLNNIGDIYSDLGEWDLAVEHFEEALGLYRANDRLRQAAHTEERLAVSLYKRGQRAQARDRLAQTGALFAKLAAWADADRVRARELEFALDAQDLVAARRLAATNSASTIAPSIRLELQRSRLLRMEGQPEAALEKLDALAQRVQDQGALYVAWLEQRAQTVSLLEPDQQTELWQAVLAAERRVVEQRYRSNVANLRVRFEVAERERELADLDREREKDLARLATADRNFSLVAALALLVMLICGALLWRLQRKRMQQNLESQQVIAQSRQLAQQALAALASQQTHASEILLRVDQPRALLNRGGHSIRVNAAWSARSESIEIDSPQLQAAIGMADEHDAGQNFDLGGEPARLDPLDPSSGLFVLTLFDRASASAPQEPVESEDPSGAQFWQQTPHREALVELMVLSLRAFERSTGKTRIELAERSKLWRVTVDDGRLRVRAMERYLSIARLPQVPRWREVIRTAFFVLAECELTLQERQQLEQRVQSLQSQADRAQIAV